MTGSIGVQVPNSSQRTTSVEGYSRAGPSSHPAGTRITSHGAKNTSPTKNYVLGDCLGRGAFGSVYRAINDATGETVAVKRIQLSSMPKGELKEIMSEIELLKELKHPNIVKYKGYEKTKDFLFLILEYCENGSLHNICKRFGKFPEGLVSVYITQVLEGLAYLHRQGVVHRDVKGANILTIKDGSVKLADFGVAARDGTISNNVVVGSPYWMAPEVINQSGASAASDIWSVGCVVVELLEGQAPYGHLDPLPALFRIVQDEMPPMPEGASNVVLDFLQHCFHKDPDRRPSAELLLQHPWMMAARRQLKEMKSNGTIGKAAARKGSRWNGSLAEPVPMAKSKSADSRPELARSPPSLRRIEGRISRPSSASPSNSPALTPTLLSTSASSRSPFQSIGNVQGDATYNRAVTSINGSANKLEAEADMCKSESMPTLAHAKLSSTTEHHLSASQARRVDQPSTHRLASNLSEGPATRRGKAGLAADGDGHVSTGGAKPRRPALRADRWRPSEVSQAVEVKENARATRPSSYCTPRSQASEAAFEDAVTARPSLAKRWSTASTVASLARHVPSSVSSGRGRIGVDPMEMMPPIPTLKLPATRSGSGRDDWTSLLSASEEDTVWTAMQQLTSDENGRKTLSPSATRHFRDRDSHSSHARVSSGLTSRPHYHTRMQVPSSPVAAQPPTPTFSSFPDIPETPLRTTFDMPLISTTVSGLSLSTSVPRGVPSPIPTHASSAMHLSHPTPSLTRSLSTSTTSTTLSSDSANLRSPATAKVARPSIPPRRQSLRLSPRLSPDPSQSPSLSTAPFGGGGGGNRWGLVRSPSSGRSVVDVDVDVAE